MIVTGVVHTVLRRGRTSAVYWRCLARRGMLHSECEAVDFIRLEPGSYLDLDSADGIEEFLLVLRGSVTLSFFDEAPTGPGRPRELSARTAVLAPHGSSLRVRANVEDVELLSIRGLPARVSAALPPRVPDLTQ